MTQRSWRLVNLALLALFFVGSLTAYDRVPGRFPAHFDLAGNPTRWDARSLVSWMMLPLVAAGITLLLVGLSRWSGRRPDLWNVPDKKRFLALSPEARRPIVHRLERFVEQVNTIGIVILMAVQWAIFHAATSPSPRMPVWIVAVAPAATVVILVAALRMNAAIADEIREAHRAMSGG